MKILHTVEFYNPSVGGAQEVVKQLSEHLVTMGHEVTVATTKIPERKRKTINGVKIVDFDIAGNEVRGYSGKDIKKYQQFLINSKFDVIMNYAAQQWTTDLMFRVLDQIKAKKILVPCGFSGLYDPGHRTYFEKLPVVLRKYNATIYLSHDYRDIAFARKHKLRNIIVIPNGADEREFAEVNTENSALFKKRWGIKDTDKLIISVGNHTGLKGHAESIKAFQKSKLKNSTLLIIGDTNWGGGCYRKCLRSAWIYNNIISKVVRSHNRIEVINLNRRDTITAFQTADLFLFLSNIECSPLVLFESAAAGVPFVASSAGNSKEIVGWTKSGLIAKSKTDKNGATSADIFHATKLMEKVLDDQNLCERMSKSGKTAWKSKFTWEKIAKEYEKTYEKK
jgi:glycosyltransferase involved in cell wall biosynthesis